MKAAGLGRGRKMGVLDDGHDRSSGYGTVSVSCGVAVARVKERRDAARAVQGCRYRLEARHEEQWFSSSARAARQKAVVAGWAFSCDRRVGTEAPCPGTAKSAEQEVSPAAAHERPAGHEEAPGRQSQEWCQEVRARDMSG